MGLFKTHGEIDINKSNKGKASPMGTTPVSKKKAKKAFTPKKVSYNDPDDLKGKRLAKWFGKDLFFGVIKGHEIDEGVIYWQIEYDDGDAEDFEEVDLGMAFALYEKNQEFDEIGKNGSSESISVDDDDDDNMTRRKKLLHQRIL